MSTSPLPYPPMHTPLHGLAALQQRLDHLTDLLRQHEDLWRPRPFVEERPAWTARHPDLTAWLDALSPEAIDALDADPHDAPSPPPEPWPSLLRAIDAAIDLPDPAQAPPLLPDVPDLRWRIPARKWAQIEAFAAQVRQTSTLSPDGLLDWCAGKGHLGRAIACATDQPVLHVERQATLCAQGKHLSDRLGVESAFHQADVLTPHPLPQPPPEAPTAIALHACGALTDTLLRLAITHRWPALFAAPCCHHMLGHATTWAPLSQRGAAAGLLLAPRELRLAIYDEVIARPAERVARRREMAWRHAVDLLIQQATGDPTYRPLGPLPPHLWRLPFPEFARQAVARKQHPLPDRFNAEDALQRGAERAHTARARALLRALFRRPLELWLVLDRALLLAEAGRDTAVLAFCPRDLTPRNLLIRSLA